MLPLSSAVELSAAATLALALVLGLGFGFILERAGFGSARKLTAVFYFYDMSVVKVMFTAIVTAMAGLFLLSAAGALDLAELYVEPTNYVGAAVGGLLFGTGFVVGGYCPGTSIAACATGRLDALGFLGGMLAGVYLFAELLPGVDQWARATARGEVTLPSLTGLSMGWFVLLFAAILGAAAWGMRAAEKRFAGLRP
jgi:uncharacterized membrane protein YedE/YeeE